LSLRHKSKVKSILSKDPLGVRLSYDANRLYLQHTDRPDDLETCEAIAELRTALRTTKTDAIPVRLARGDALIIDNHRVLVRGAERPLRRRMWWFRDRRQQVRWIRLYAGYPYKSETRAVPPSQDAQALPSLT